MDTFFTSDWLTSALILAAEIGAALSVIFFLLHRSVRKRDRQEIELLKRMIEMLRKREPVRITHLHNLLLENQKMDEDRAKEGARRLMGAEKAIYNKLIKIFSRAETEAILTVNQEIEQMTEHYQRVINDAVGVINDFKMEDQPADVKQTMESLQKENARLGAELDEAINTIESMMKEYMSMYGGTAKKDGVKHLENQLHQLNQKIRRQVVVPVVGGADAPVGEAPASEGVDDMDVGADLPEPDIIDLDGPGEEQK